MGSIKYQNVDVSLLSGLNTQKKDGLVEWVFYKEETCIFAMIFILLDE